MARTLDGSFSMFEPFEDALSKSVLAEILAPATPIFRTSQADFQNQAMFVISIFKHF